MSTSVSSPIRLRLEDDVLWASINRPEVRNAIDIAVLEGFEAMVAMAQKSGPKLLVIRGEGGTFCSGADLREVERLLSEPEELRNFMARLGRVFSSLEASPWVNLAVIEGFAVAGGCELLLACDVVLASDSSRIGDYHVENGLVPAAGASVRLTEALAPARARDLLLSGRVISGREAAATGLASASVPDEMIDLELERMVELFRSKGQGSLATIKEMIQAPRPAERGLRLDRELDLFIEHASSPEFKDSLKRFRERRQSSSDDETVV